MTRRHGSKARYCHGPDENNVAGKGCRCDLCITASLRTSKQRNLLIARGQWQPYVPAGRARDHVKMLGEYGIGYRQVVRLSGVPQGAITKLLYGGPGDRPPSRRIRPETEAAILAVKAVPGNLAESALVDVTGTRRRLQALIASGWPQRWLADRLGVTWKEFYAAMYRQERVEAATARAVAGLYDQLWNCEPPQDTPAQQHAVRNARKLAEKRRWPLPQAWDDDVIDNPQATAENCRRRRKLSQAELVEEARELIEQQSYTVEFAAGRLGVRVNTLETAIRRARKAA